MIIEDGYKLKPKCDMMINQNISIGDDPIGHCCFNIADYQTETHFICSECKQKLENGDTSVSFGYGTVKIFPDVVKAYLKSCGIIKNEKDLNYIFK